MSKFNELEQAVRQAEASYSNYESKVLELWNEFGTGLSTYLEAPTGGVKLEPAALMHGYWEFRIELKLADTTIIYSLTAATQSDGHLVTILLDGVGPEAFTVRSQHRAKDLQPIYKTIFDVTKSYCENNIKFFQEKKGYPKIGFPG
jgi:hypothetical protein